jgi:hypothetical protein
MTVVQSLAEQTVVAERPPFTALSTVGGVAAQALAAENSAAAYAALLQS